MDREELQQDIICHKYNGVRKVPYDKSWHIVRFEFDKVVKVVKTWRVKKEVALQALEILDDLRHNDWSLYCHILRGSHR